MHIHILGVAGTFMGSLAQLLKAQGHKVTGSDKAIYPPMSDQLAQAGIDVIASYEAKDLPKAERYVIGNAISRGNPQLEYILNEGLSYTSGPQILADVILPGRWVLAVAGTHGKTTTSSMLAWLLEWAGMKPGYLIGGVPSNFSTSARLGETPFFVIEADEYDTALFDKRSKFVHYHPRTLIMNNLEFDHADIFDDLAAIERQFHHLVRTLPTTARIILPDNEPALERVLQKGCWSEVERFGKQGEARVEPLVEDYSHFAVSLGEQYAEVNWSLCGLHNMNNAVAAMLAARHVGITLEQSAQALAEFVGVKRRLELLANVNGIRVYDDFAHHPTAIDLTLDGLRRHVGDENIMAVIEPRSNTMKLGVHQQALAQSTVKADQAFWYQAPNLDWSVVNAVKNSTTPQTVISDLDELVKQLVNVAKAPCHLVLMSNGSFAGLHQKLITALKTR